MGGLHSIYQQFEFRQFQQPGADEVTILCAFDADDIMAHVDQKLDIMMNTFSPCVDAVTFPKTQDI